MDPFKGPYIKPKRTQNWGPGLLGLRLCLAGFALGLARGSRDRRDLSQSWVWGLGVKGSRGLGVQGFRVWGLGV